MLVSMRWLLISCVTLLALGVAAEESKQETPTLDDILVQEVNGDFDDASLPGADQINAAEKRFEGYMRRATSKVEKDEIYKTFEFVSDRIMDRLKEKLRLVREKAEKDEAEPRN